MDDFSSCYESCLFVKSRHHDVLIRVLEMLIWFHKPPSVSTSQSKCDSVICGFFFCVSLVHTLPRDCGFWMTVCPCLCVRVPGSSLSHSLSLFRSQTLTGFLWIWAQCLNKYESALFSVRTLSERQGFVYFASLSRV